MLSRLNQLSAEFDRTAAMGLFPHDEVAAPLRRDGNDRLMSIADTSDDPALRDDAIWELVYRTTEGRALDQLSELVFSVATSAKESVLRRSGSWALLKLGQIDLLNQCLRADDDGNTHSWKQHLIYESQGRTDWVDPRPARAIESKLGYAVTLPLTIHGVVQFRDYKYEKEGHESATHEASFSYDSRKATKGASGNYPGEGSYSSYSGTQIVSTPPSYGSVDPRNYQWRSLAAGPIGQRRLVGDLTAAVGRGSFYDNLVIQKVSTNPLGNRLDHVQGYLFRGMSRSLGGNAMAHYYTSRGPQPLYLSGRIGDASDGVIEVETQLVRHAETHIVVNKNIDYPYVQSVRGLFFGPARMNPVVLANEDVPIDNLLQIVKEPYANGWFFGEFRSVPVDVDGDGQVEINGMEMYTDLAGNVLDRTPSGPQPSLQFAR